MSNALGYKAPGRVRIEKWDSRFETRNGWIIPPTTTLLQSRTTICQIWPSHFSFFGPCKTGFLLGLNLISGFVLPCVIDPPTRSCSLGDSPSPTGTAENAGFRY